jgi:hypothetical protein
VAEQTIDERMKQLDEALDKFEKDAAIPDNTAPGPETELQEYLQMDRNDIERLNGADCAAIAYRLAQFSFYIQRMINRDKARITWVKTQLARFVTSDSDYDKFRKFEVAVELLGKTNTAVARLSVLLRWAQQRVDRLEYTATGLKTLSDIMVTNQRAKRAMEYADE